MPLEFTHRQQRTSTNGRVPGVPKKARRAKSHPLSSLRRGSICLVSIWCKRGNTLRIENAYLNLSVLRHGRHHQPIPEKRGVPTRPNKAQDIVSHSYPLKASAVRHWQRRHINLQAHTIQFRRSFLRHTSPTTTLTNNGVPGVPDQTINISRLLLSLSRGVLRSASFDVGAATDTGFRQQLRPIRLFRKRTSPSTTRRRKGRPRGSPTKLTPSQLPALIPTPWGLPLLFTWCGRITRHKMKCHFRPIRNL